MNTDEIKAYDRVRIGKGSVDWCVCEIRTYDDGGPTLAIVTTLLGKRRQVVNLDRLTKVTTY
jgi:hypothetical protein